MKKTVAVIFGGRSTEHDVSIVTAIASVINPLKLSGTYTVVPVYITKQGAWYAGAQLGDISLYRSDAIDRYLAKRVPVDVQLDGSGKLVLVGTKRGFGKPDRSVVDVAFPAMHGTHGEDGELMGLLEMAGVPYVGCSVPASVLAMDKVLAKLYAQVHGLPIAKFEYFMSKDFAVHAEGWAKKINASLRYPLFVKPAHLGSSIGISRVTGPKDLLNALEVAAHYDDKVLVEEGVQNLIEVTLPVIGNDDPVPAFLEQPMVASEDFFDFDTKYIHGGGKKAHGGTKSGGKAGAQGYSRIPADISAALYAKAEQLGLDAYKALGCSGIARVDMLIDSKTNEVYFNEVNPLPGSLYAHNWQQKGVSNVELVNRLIGYAEARAESRKRLQTGFDTSFLKQF